MLYYGLALHALDVLLKLVPYMLALSLSQVRIWQAYRDI